MLTCSAWVDISVLEAFARWGMFNCIAHGIQGRKLLHTLSFKDTDLLLQPNISAFESDNVRTYEGELHSTSAQPMQSAV